MVPNLDVTLITFQNVIYLTIFHKILDGLTLTFQVDGNSFNNHQQQLGMYFGFLTDGKWNRNTSRPADRK